MFGPEKILWIKNIKRNGGDDIAYKDVSCNETFLLSFSTKFPNAALKGEAGDIIVLFQKLNKINGRRNKEVLLTHLVSPVSNKSVISDLDHTHRYCREVRLIAKADPIEAIPNPGYLNFFKPNRGSLNPIINLDNTIGLNEENLKQRIWNLFYDHICTNIDADLSLNDDLIYDFGEEEGGLMIREHIKQEYRRRHSGIIKTAKDYAFIKNGGKLLCECCDFDFFQNYGEVGFKFIECHHKTPISFGKRITKINDLALVCSNCHRMLHRKLNNGKYHSVESLRNAIKVSNKS